MDKQGKFPEGSTVPASDHCLGAALQFFAAADAVEVAPASSMIIAPNMPCI